MTTPERREAGGVREALERIAAWSSFPTATLRDGTKCSYGAAYGSNGERDYMREVARAALARDEATCVCGEPTTPDVVHRKDGPCHRALPPAARDEGHARRAIDVALGLLREAMNSVSFCLAPVSECKHGGACPALFDLFRRIDAFLDNVKCLDAPASRADGQEKGAVRWIVCPNGDYLDERAVTLDDESEARHERDRRADGAEAGEEWGIIPLYPRPAAVPEAGRGDTDRAFVQRAWAVLSGSSTLGYATKEQALDCLLRQATHLFHGESNGGSDA